MAAVRVDGDGIVVEVDPGWDQRLERHGLVILRAAEVVGRALTEFLEARRAEAWLGFLERLRSSLVSRSTATSANNAIGTPPPWSDDALLNRLRPWPGAGDSIWLSLDGREVEGWLRDPLLRVEKGRVEPCNEAARVLFNAREDLYELRRLESFLASRQPSLHLVPSRDIRLRGRPFFFFRRPSLYGIEAFDVLARLIRAGLHDLANPLSAMRMMADVSMRGGSFFGDSPLGDVTGHLDGAIDSIHALRSLIYADGSASELEVAKELEVISSLFRSELARRELELETRAHPGAKVVAGTNSFRLLVSAGLCSTCNRAAPGSRIRLEWSDSGDDVKQLTCWIDGQGPPSLNDLYPTGALLERLTRACDGEVLVAPGERQDGDPDWQVELYAN